MAKEPSEELSIQLIRYACLLLVFRTELNATWACYLQGLGFTFIYLNEKIILLSAFQSINFVKPTGQLLQL